MIFTALIGLSTMTSFKRNDELVTVDNSQKTDNTGKVAKLGMQKENLCSMNNH
jgi:hypothetical protein